MPIAFKDIAEIAKRYAKAAFLAAKEKKALSAVEGDLVNFRTSLKENRELESFCSSPVFDKIKRQRAITEICKAEKFNSVSSNLLILLASHSRINIVTEIVDEFLNLLAIERNEATVNITSTFPISAKQEKEIIASFEKSTKKNIKIKSTIDKEIIGGVTFLVGSKMLDGSIRSALNRMEAESKKILLTL